MSTSWVCIFLALGRTSTLANDTDQQLEEFTCWLYGGTPTFDISTLRHDKFLQRYSPKSGTLLSAYSGADMNLLPPCKDVMRMHIERANHQALVWYNAYNTWHSTAMWACLGNTWWTAKHHMDRRPTTTGENSLLTGLLTYHCCWTGLLTYMR